MTKRVACIGNLTRDTLFWVDALPAVDDVSTVRNSKECFGGRGAIVALVLSALGCEVDLLMTVPSTGFRELKSFFASYNCSTDALEVDETATLHNRVLVTIGKKDQNCTSLYVKGDCNAVLTKKQLGILKNASIAYFSSHDIDISIHALKQIESSVATIIVNVSSYMVDSPEYLSLIQTHSGIVIGNRLEIEHLMEKMSCAKPSELFTCFPKAKFIIMTMGEKGVACYSQNGTFETLPATKVEAVKTPLGVGDAFIAGIVYGEYMNWHINKRLRAGLDLAARSIESDESCLTKEVIQKCIQNVNNHS